VAHVGGDFGDFETGDEADIRVHWPDGEAGRWTTVDADRFLRIERAGSEPKPW
jgi:hypothetical protein